MGKAFEKETKTIEEQGEKQIKAIQDNKEQSVSIKNYDYKDKLLLKKEREIFKKNYNDRLNQIEYLNDKVDYDNLKYTVISSGEEFEFDKSEDPILFLSTIKEGNISVEQAKNIQQDYERYLNSIGRGNKTAKQKKPLENSNILFNARNKVINFIEDYGSMILEAMRLANKKEQDLKY